MEPAAPTSDSQLSTLARSLIPGLLPQSRALDRVTQVGNSQPFGLRHPAKLRNLRHLHKCKNNVPTRPLRLPCCLPFPRHLHPSRAGASLIPVPQTRNSRPICLRHSANCNDLHGLMDGKNNSAHPASAALLYFSPRTFAIIPQLECFSVAAAPLCSPMRWFWFSLCLRASAVNSDACLPLPGRPS